MINVPRLLLFDVDSTLIASQHKTIGTYSSYLVESLSIVFQQTIERNGVKFAGGTDPGITEALLKSYNITEENCEGYHEKIKKAFDMLPDIAKKGIEEGRYSWRTLPNANELLKKLSQRSDVKVALLTGNLQSVASVKLQAAGVDVSIFTWGEDGELFGAFGSDDGDRSKLVKIARERYLKHLGTHDVKPNDMVVIGDTPKDISCAHDNGVPCVAVTTGSYSKEDLKDADFVLENGFENIDETIKALVETCA